MRFSKRAERMPVLGALEIAVLRESWRSPAALEARDVLANLTERRISLSTIQATLERLHRKGLLARTKVHRAYRYSPAVSETKLIGTLIRDLAERVAAGELEPVIAGFIDLLHDARPELLDRVESKVSERKGQGRS